MTLRVIILRPTFRFCCSCEIPFIQMSIKRLLNVCKVKDLFATYELKDTCAANKFKDIFNTE